MRDSKYVSDMATIIDKLNPHDQILLDNESVEQRTRNLRDCYLRKRKSLPYIPTNFATAGQLWNSTPEPKAQKRNKSMIHPTASSAN